MCDEKNNPAYSTGELKGTDWLRAAVAFCDMPCRYDFEKTLGLYLII